VSTGKRAGHWLYAKLDTMFAKDGKYYADWRDRSGKRLRLSFTSKRAALQHEAEQKELAHPKKLTAEKVSLISSPSQFGRMSRVAHGKQPAKLSLLRQVPKAQKNSGPPTSRKRRSS
jgi:hypothetical protein